jgi:hypothetical protein
MVVLSKRGDAGGDPPSFGEHGGRDCRIGEHFSMLQKDGKLLPGLPY